MPFNELFSMPTFSNVDVQKDSVNSRVLVADGFCRKSERKKNDIWKRNDKKVFVSRQKGGVRINTVVHLFKISSLLLYNISPRRADRLRRLAEVNAAQCTILVPCWLNPMNLIAEDGMKLVCTMYEMSCFSVSLPSTAFFCLLLLFRRLGYHWTLNNSYIFCCYSMIELLKVT